MAAGQIQLGNWLLLIGALLFVVAMFNAVRASRQLRAAAYYAIRQEALSRTRRWAFLATIALLATGGLAIYQSNQRTSPTIARANTPTPAVIDVPSRILPTATSTTSPTRTPAWTPLPTLTSTPTMLPTASLPPDLPGILRTPVPSAVPASANARLVFTTLASQVDSKGVPSDPGLAFPGGTRSVRLFFQASHVNNGAVWSILCYQGNRLVDSVVELWKWGPRTQTARAFCGIDGSPGDYTVAVYLGPAKQFEVDFTLLPVTPTPLPSTSP
ncbi:MAG TPA: hypothetical protein VLG46_05850 [Anaerolineae bacterium]|nr:hypothetical protein [Anaerolineae bacterium]